MKRPARALSITAAVGLSLSLVGCVQQDDSDATADIDTQSGPCTESPGLTDDSIQLGILTDLSGPVAAGGIPWSQGAQTFFDYANSELDGVNGRQVSVEVADHAYDPQAALQRYQELESEVLAIPLSFGSAANNAIAGELPDDCMPLVANNGSITDVKPNLFYNAAPYESQTLNGIDWYLQQGNAQPRVALLYQGDVYGEGVKAALEYAADQRGFEIVSAQSYAIGDQSYSGQLAAITAADPDVVVMASTVGATFGFFGEAQAAGATWDWLGLQPTFAPAVLGLPIADAYVRDFTIATGQPTLDGGGPATQTAFENLNAVSPELATDPSSLLGWQAAYLMYEALLVADESDAGLTRGSVLEALANLDVDSNGLGAGQFTFDPDSAVPGVPTHASAVVRIDPNVTGYLTVAEPYTTSDMVSGFLEEL